MKHKKYFLHQLFFDNIARRSVNQRTKHKKYFLLMKNLIHLLDP